MNIPNMMNLENCMRKIDISASEKDGTTFLLESRPKSEYQEYCDIFNAFITGPAIEKREIAELTQKYQHFYNVLISLPVETKISNELEGAVYEVAIEAEMQGFIYGIKLFEALLNKQLVTA